MNVPQPALRPLPFFAASLPFYYGWIHVLVAAFAMVATLPGRTQGLGLITESLMTDLALDRGGFARINFWATLIGSLACIGFGRLIDRFGSRAVLTILCVALGLVVLGMSRIETVAALALGVTLTRALGQSALSVASLSVTPQWFSARLPQAMAVYSIVMSIGFMVAFPLVGAVVSGSGWRAAWGGIGWALALGMAPLAWLLVRRSPEEAGLAGEPSSPSRLENHRPSAAERTLGEALRTPLFWVFALGAALYGLVVSGIGLFNESILVERGFQSSDYHQALAVTAITALFGNFGGGWLGARVSSTRLMAGAMGLLAIGLLSLPHLQTRAELMAQATLMGVAGGVVAVLFFSIWRQEFGRQHLGRVQGAAQMLTVIGSATGPVLLAEVAAATGSYALAFRALAVLVALVGIAALWIRPARPARSGSPFDTTPDRA